MGNLCLYLFCYALLWVHFFAIILKRKRKLVALQWLSCRCVVTINVLWPFLTVPWGGVQCVIVVFPDNTCLSFVFILYVDVSNRKCYNSHSPLHQLTKRKYVSTCERLLSYTYCCDTTYPCSVLQYFCSVCVCVRVVIGRSIVIILCPCL